MADERVRMTRFDVWFFRAMWISLLGVLAGLVVYIAVISIDIATAGGDGAGRRAGVFLAIQAVLMATLAWAVVRTPRQWRAFDARVANAPHADARTRRYRMIDWLRRAWQETDPTKDIAPLVAELPDDDRLHDAGLSDATIKRLRANPRAFPHTLRQFGFSFGGVRGEGVAERAVGAAHYLWSRLT